MHAGRNVRVTAMNAREGITVDELKARLKAAVAEVAACQDALAAALERRDTIVVEAVDQGVSQGEVARLLGTVRTNVHRILAGGRAIAG